MGVHRLQTSLPPRLDPRVAPTGARNAKNYPLLVDLLEEIGRRIDAGETSRKKLLDWDNRAISLLHPEEIDSLMRIDGGSNPSPGEIAETRWRNLRRILLRRKGVE